MVLRLDDRWVWDFWLADTGTDRHLFFLQAPRSLGIESRRHHRATIGHAVSADLVNWRLLPDALGPGRSGTWDDIATWTGSVIERDGTWYLLYTGISTADEGRVQRIGLATSPDLIRWERWGDRPLIEADPAWYERYDGTGWHDEAWRDPWVFADTDGDGYHALICARRRDGPIDGRGVIGHAVSADLLEWDVRPPLASPRGFGQLEVPQVVTMDGGAVLVFSGHERYVAPSRLREPPSATTGTYLCRGDGLLGPFDVPESVDLAPVSSLYSGKLVRGNDGELALMGFVDMVDDDFAGEISDPVPIDLRRARVAS